MKVGERGGGEGLSVRPRVSDVCPKLKVGHRFCQDIFPTVTIAANTNLVIHGQNLTRKMPELLRKYLVSGCYYEHCVSVICFTLIFILGSSKDSIP